MSIKPDYYDNLDKLHDEIVAKLTRGVLDKKSPYRYFVLSTSIKNNVNSRMVVLRNFCSKKWELLLHSDCRSKKFQEIESNRNVSLNFWDPKKSIQLRVKGKAEKFNETNNYAWSRLNVWSKRTYLTQKKPGSVSTSPISGFSEKFLKTPPNNEEINIGFKNFCQIKVFIKKIDCLILSRFGYRRALFEIKGDKLNKKWLVP